jgi:MerR family transcriptional regulator, copper efflux regulator
MKAMLSPGICRARNFNYPGLTRATGVAYVAKGFVEAAILLCRSKGNLPARNYFAAPKPSHCARLAMLVSMNVSDLSKATGVSIHRLRRYEALGLIVCTRSQAGYREFSADTVREVVFISMGRDLGFALKELADVLPRYRSGGLSIEDMVTHLNTRIAQVDAQIGELQTLRVKLVDHIGWFKAREQRWLQKQTSKAVAKPSPAKSPVATKTMNSAQSQPQSQPKSQPNSQPLLKAKP